MATTTRQDLATAREDQLAFEGVREGLLKAHKGRYVLFKGGKVVSDHQFEAEAYKAGLEKFGTDTTFLVQHVVPTGPSSVSLAWRLGLMLGPR